VHGIECVCVGGRAGVVSSSSGLFLSHSHSIIDSMIPVTPSNATKSETKTKKGCTCYICGKVFNSRSTTGRHIKKWHEGGARLHRRHASETTDSDSDLSDNDGNVDDDDIPHTTWPTKEPTVSLTPLIHVKI
jgi:hypothetical protein